MDARVVVVAVVAPDESIAVGVGALPGQLALEPAGDVVRALLLPVQTQSVAIAECPSAAADDQGAPNACARPPATCAGGARTTLSEIYDPAGRTPLPNVNVYVPNAALDTIPDGPRCYPSDPLTETSVLSVSPIVQTTTDATGRFTLGATPGTPRHRDAMGLPANRLGAVVFLCATSAWAASFLRGQIALDGHTGEDPNENDNEDG